MRRILWLSAFLGAALHLNCSLNTEVAGGSGAGNPGGASVVAILADTVATIPALQKSLADPTRIITLPDDGGTTVLLSSARITVYEIHFMLEDSALCAALLDTFDSDLSCDSLGIVLRGPFVFDAITGASDSLFDTLRLPVARYRGIKLAIGCTDEPDSPLCSPMEIEGKFTFKDTLRDLRMLVRFNTVLLHKYTGAPVELDPHDTTFFRLTLDARQWLSGFALSSSLDSGEIELDSTGVLFLDGATGGTEARNITEAVRANVQTSFTNAKLKISSEQ